MFLTSNLRTRYRANGQLRNKCTNLVNSGKHLFLQGHSVSHLAGSGRLAGRPWEPAIARSQPEEHETLQFALAGL